MLKTKIRASACEGSTLQGSIPENYLESSAFLKDLKHRDPRTPCGRNPKKISSHLIIQLLRKVNEKQ